MIDHRWSQRFDADLEVHIATLDGIITAGRIRNISLYGLFVEADRFLNVNTYVHVRFALPNDANHSECEIGAVIIHCNSHGMGMMVDTTVADADTIMHQLKRCFSNPLFPNCGSKGSSPRDYKIV